MNPETLHNIAINLCSLLSKSKICCRLVSKIFSPKKSIKKRLWGYCFKNPVGLAAGFDKNGIAIPFLDSLGFSHIEIGSISKYPQSGNSKPRIFKYKKSNSIINKMGCPNCGVDALVERLSKSKYKRKCILGFNIVKNKDTPLEEAYKDINYCISKLSVYSDYFTINLSSPNTPNLKQLQNKKYLEQLLKTVPKIKPILLKISPDIKLDELDELIDLAIRYNIHGIVATNTLNFFNIGGISGRPIKDISNNIIKYIKHKSNNKLIIIGVGGIFNSNDAKEKINSGASLVQIYSGLVYRGIGIVKKIMNDL